MLKLKIFILIPLICFLCSKCIDFALADNNKPLILKASWYSIESLKKEGTYKYSKGVMANGHKFKDNNFTCATRLYPLGTWLQICNTKTNKNVRVKVTDRISKRFAKTRIDLSKSAFNQIASLEQGITPVEIKVLK